VGTNAFAILRPEWMVEIAREVEAFVRSLDGAAADSMRLERFFTSLPAPERDLERWILNDIRDRLALSHGLVGRHTRAEHARDLLLDEYRTPWTLDRLARAVGCNRTTLQTEFQTLTGATVHQFLVHRRVSAAVQMLEESDLKASRVSREVGYRSHSAFLRHFKKITGVTLTSYRVTRLRH
jgi:AraC-like DNA-binding protein